MSCGIWHSSAWLCSVTAGEGTLRIRLQGSDVQVAAASFASESIAWAVLWVPGPQKSTERIGKALDT